MELFSSKPPSRMKLMNLIMHNPSDPRVPVDESEGIRERLREIANCIAENRATGRTARLVNDIIEKFFSEEINTKIFIRDHYHSIKSDHMLAKKIKARLDSEYPNIEYTLVLSGTVPYIIRRSMTQTERLKEEYHKLREQLAKKIARSEW